MPTRSKGLRANHSAAHLLHAALRKILGTGAAQRCGKIEADRLTLDFTWDEALRAEEIVGVEAEINAQIRRNEAVATRLMTPDDALAQGALAHFGEKYGDEVRVLSIGRGEDVPYSLELCAGTHVSATGDIAFKIVSDSLAGPRPLRLEALTGQAAFDFMSGRTVPQDPQAQSEALVQPAQRDFFISYTGKNLESAQEVGLILREAGFSFCAQFQDFDSGSNFVLGMQDGLRHSKRVSRL